MSAATEVSRMALRVCLIDILEMDPSSPSTALVARSPSYEYRNRLVLLALFHSMTLGYPCGIKIDPNEPEWPCAYIELPTGQVAWHMEQYKGTYDGHETDEKVNRIQRFVDSNN